MNPGAGPASTFTSTKNGPSSFRMRSNAARYLFFVLRLQNLLHARAARHAGEAAAHRRRRRLTARRLVHLVVPHDDRQIRRRRVRHRAELPQVHQHRAVAVQRDNPRVRPRNRHAHRDRGALAHRAEGVEVQRPVGDLLHVQRRLPRFVTTTSSVSFSASSRVHASRFMTSTALPSGR